VTLDLRDDTVVRIRPRANLEVNRYFICDHGRGHYRWMNRGDRLEAPLVRDGADLRAVDWDEALDRVRTLVRGAGGSAVALVSPKTSTEGLYFARKLLSRFSWTGAFQVVMGEEAALAGVPNLALRAERAPNGKGAELLGYGRAYAAAVQAAETAAVVLVIDDPEAQVKTSGQVIYLGTAAPAFLDPSVILPMASMVEEDGTYVNRDARVQRYFQARGTPAMARPAWWVLGQLSDAPPETPSAAFDQMAADVEAFRGMSYATLGLTGQRAGAAAGVGVPA
jgi:NADH-quinone oxidoreductase subunit G